TCSSIGSNPNSSSFLTESFEKIFLLPSFRPRDIGGMRSSGCLSMSLIIKPRQIKHRQKKQELIFKVIFPHLMLTFSTPRYHLSPHRIKPNSTEVITERESV